MSHPSRPNRAWAGRPVGKRALVWSLVAITIWIQSATPVISEECYYWLYGVNLDWSYFDHPGMIGWTIRLGTEMLGHDAIGLRLVAGLSWTLITWIGLRWLRDLGAERSSELLWLALSLGVPVFAAGHLLATPDAPLTAFYCLSARELWKLSRSPARWRFALAGAYIGLALLTKYTAAFLLLGCALHLCLEPAFRRRVRPLDVVTLLGCTAMTFLPAILWNGAHDWASFLFQTERRAEALRISLESPLRFVGSQLLLVSPLLLWVGARSTAWALRRARANDGRYVALVAYALPLPLFLVACSVAVGVRVHWSAPAYVPLALLGTMWWQAEGRGGASATVRRVGAAWIALSWIACLALPGVRYLPQLGGAHWDPGQEIASRALNAARTLDQDRDGRAFLFTANHRESAELVWGQVSRGAQPTPSLPVLAQNVRGRRARQFDYWTDPREIVGWDAIYALDGTEERARRIAEVRGHFESVDLVDTVELTLGSWVLRRVRLFACRNYRGPTHAGPHVAAR